MRYAIRWFKCKLKPPKNDVNTEPHMQMIDRGDEDDGIRIIEIDELI